MLTLEIGFLKWREIEIKEERQAMSERQREGIAQFP